MAKTEQHGTRTRSLFEVVRVLGRVVLPVALAVVIGGALLVALLVVYARLIGEFAFAQLLTVVTTPEAATVAVLGLMLPVLLLFLLAALTWAGVVVQRAGAVLGGPKAPLGMAALRGLARAPKAALVTLMLVLGILLAIVLAPVIMLAGIVGLIVDAVAHPAGKRWPSRRTLITTAIPFGLATHLIVAWALALPSVWLAKGSVLAAFRDSSVRARGQELGIGITLIVGFAITWVVTEGLATLAVMLGFGTPGEAVGRILALVVIGPLVLVAMTVRYFRGGDAPASQDAVRAPARGVRTAIAVSVALVLPLAVTAAPAPASATGSEAATYTIQINADPILADQYIDIFFRARNAANPEATAPTGSITITIDGVPQGTFDLVGANSPYILTQAFSAGSHTIESSYSGDDLFAPVTAEPLTFTVGASTSVTLAAGAESGIYGKPLTLTATVGTSGPASGSVEFAATPTAGGTTDVLGTAPVSSGLATYDVTTLLPGLYDFTATYLGDGTNPQATGNTVQLRIDPAATQTTFTITPPSPTPAGVDLVAHVMVVNTESDVIPQGMAIMRYDGQGDSIGEAPLDAQGKADVDFSLDPGVLQRVVVFFEPAPGFQGSHIDESHTVTTFESGVLLEKDEPSTVFGESLGLTATVLGEQEATGTVTFEATTESGPSIDLGQRTLVNGVAHLSTSDLPVGTYGIIAHYGGDGTSDAADSGELAHTVGKASVAIDIESNLPAPVLGDSGEFAIEVDAASPGAGLPTGTVTLKLGTTELDSAPLDFEGKATLEADLEHAGTQTYTVVFSGNANFKSGTDTLALEIGRAATTANLFDISPSPRPGGYAYGDPITFDGSVYVTDGHAPVTSGTVRLMVGGAPIGEQEVADGEFSFVIDDLPVGSSPSRNVWVEYLDDDPDFKGSISTMRPLALRKADVVPALTASPDELGVGGPVTLTATLDDLGAGPIGTVTFQTTDLVTLGVDTTIVNGVATATFTMPSSILNVVAVYSGDTNFEARTSVPLELTADKTAALVTLDDPDDIPFGTTKVLTAHVTIAGGFSPTVPVIFRTSAHGEYFATPNSSGVASLTICAGSDGDCANGIALGTDPLTITAEYPETDVNILGTSAPIGYTVSDAATTTVVSTTPAGTLIQGTAVFLKATVDATGIPATPDGSVSFFALIPRPGGGYNELPVGVDDDLDNGVAEATTSVGVGADQIRWPADSIIAKYFPVGPFASSNGTTPITVLRAGLDLEVQQPTIVPGQPVAVTVVFTHGTGVSDAYSKRVEVSVDGVLGCQAFVTAGQQTTSCMIPALSSGQHVLTAHYPGDDVYLPADSGPLTVGAGQGTPTFSAAILATPVIAGQNSTVTWSGFDPSATGTMRVFVEGGSEWCVAPIAQGQCTGTFATATGPGTFATVRLQYSGDDHWDQAERTANAVVLACAIVDVTNPTTALGTVQIHTAPNCGATGYLSGTTITVTATPIAPNEFVRWEKLSGPGFVFASDQLTTSFVVTTDSTTWVHRAIFFAACFPVSADPTGVGGIGIYPDSNCTTRDGASGYKPGTALTVWPVPQYNPLYDEPDAFYAWGALPPGATLGSDSAGPLTKFTPAGPVVIPIVFGPQCRGVFVGVAPVTAGDRTNIETQRNCDSPQASGFTRFTDVTVTATSGKAGRILSSWSVDGVVRPDLGREPRVTVMIESPAPVITANFVSCYKLDLRFDTGDYQGHEYGNVTSSAPPNCPDGSARYLEGTKVTLTPVVEYQGVQFTGFDELGKLYTAPGGTGPIPALAKTYTMDKDLVVTAGFYLAESCSKLTIKGDASLISFDATGCGAGYYFDLQKQEARRAGMGQIQAQVANFKYRSTLLGVIPDDVPMDVYVSIQGDTENCFGQGGNDLAASVWKTYGPLQRPNPTCDIGGDVTVEAQACQTVENFVSIHVAGDAAGTTYGPQDLPSQLYLKDSKGNIGAWSLDGFRWVDSSAVQVVGDGFGMVDIAAGPCREAGNAFPAGTDIAVFATAPSNGFKFEGWRDLVEDGSLLDSNPIIRTTTADRKMPSTADFTVTCFPLSLSAGITVVEPAPYCPGTPVGGLNFIGGSAVQVKAQQAIDDRALLGFEGDIEGAQITEDETTGEQYGYVYMDGNKHVTASYPTKTETVGLIIIKSLKIVAGIAAVALPIIAGIAFPGVGLVLAGLAAASGIASAIPGGDKVASVFDLVDPTNITNCAARWAFNNPGDPTGGYNVGGQLATANNLNNIRQGKDVLTAGVKDLRSLPFGLGAKVPAKLAAIPGGLTYGIGIASFGYGLYDAGIGNVSLDAQTIQGIRDTSTMTNCLDDQWRAAGSDISDNNSVERAPGG